MIPGSTALCSCSLLNLEEQLPHVTKSSILVGHYRAFVSYHYRAFVRNQWGVKKLYSAVFPSATEVNAKDKCTNLQKPVELWYKLGGKRKEIARVKTSNHLATT